MMFKKNLILCVVFVSLSGCMTDRIASRQDFEILEASLTKRVNRMATELSHAKRGIQENRNALQMMEESSEEIARRFQSIEGKMGKSSASAEKMTRQFETKIKKMMNIVSEENKRLIKEINKSRQSRQSSSSHPYTKNTSKRTNASEANNEFETGYYHLVEPGESLSKIAIRYQVPIEDIIHSNNMDNPNALYVGQKLFIPEPPSSQEGE